MMESAHAHSKLFSHVEYEIISQMKRMRRSEKEWFIVKAELEEILNIERLKKIFEDTSCDEPGTINRIKKNWLGVVGVLVYSDWKDWATFKDIFMNEESGFIDDKTLPFATIEKIPLDGKVALDFHRNQWIFAPKQIVEHQDYRAQPEERLPFQDSKLINRGGFAKVWKHTIPPGYMLENCPQSTSVNLDVSLP